MTDNILVTTDGVLTFKGKTYRCALGKNGVTSNKHEGDGSTPIGSFPIREVYFREDRIQNPISPFPTRPLTITDGWCDAIDSPDYNRLVVLPFEKSHEELFRDDDVYNIIVVLGYNDNPALPGKGSAIFMHIAREGYSGTAGCIALHEKDLREILSMCSPKTEIVVVNDTK